MARRQRTKALSSFSWRREAELSAARRRFSGDIRVPSRRFGGHLSTRRIFWYSLTVAVLVAVALAIAFTLQRPEIRPFHHHPGATRSVRA